MILAGQEVTVTIESAARTHLWVYGPGGELVAEDIDNTGFISSSAEVELNAQVAGRYIVALENSLSTVSGPTLLSNLWKRSKFRSTTATGCESSSSAIVSRR